MLARFNECMEKKGRKRLCEENDNEKPKLKQSTLMKSMSGENSCGSRSSQQQEAVLRFVVGTSSPFSIVEHPDFVNLLKVCGGKAPPNRKTLMETLQKSFTEMKENLKKTLQSIPSVCTTADCWTVFRR